MNKYANLVGTNKIKDEYTKINTGFDGVETDIDALNDLVDALDSRVDTIITTPIDGEAAAQEIVDARASAVKSKTFATLDARFEETEQDVESHMADVVTDADGAHGLKIEEGTWTPTIYGSATAGTPVYTSRSGRYYKIGKLVIAPFNVRLTSKGGTSGNIRITGLPFWAADNVLVKIASYTGALLPAGAVFGGYCSGVDIVLEYVNNNSAGAVTDALLDDAIAIYAATAIYTIA